MPKLEEGWLTVLLVCALSFISAAAVEACQWSEGLWTAWCTGLFGILAGLALAKSLFDGKTAALFATVYGIFCVGFFIGLLLPGDWHFRSVSLVVRMSTFISKLILGGASRDALPFPVLIASLFWLMGVVGAWMLFRRRSVWPAILPTGLMLVINAYYYQGPANLSVHLAFYVLASLLLLGHTSVLLREREWRRAGVVFNPELRFEFLRAGLVVALAGTFAAWVAPSIQASPAVAAFWQQSNSYWTTVRETWMRLFSSLRGYGQTSTDFYGDLLALGGPSLLSDAPIMDVSLNALRGEAETDPLAGARYYWRAVAFERYQNGQWLLSEDAAFRETPAGAPPLALGPYQLRRDVSALFTMRVTSTSRLYVVPQPKLVSLANKISAVYTVLTAPDNSVDPSVVRAREVLVGNRRIYRVIGSVSVADEESLRSAGDDYPLWVTAHYLQLPPEITDRTRQLAREIADSAGARNPYDRAQAVTDWLRANITYDPLIQAPPAGQEPVDWLLYTSRRGYCNYYASAEVVLLRILGIPARLAAGFSQGDYEEPAASGGMATYHVVEKHAHAWVEVFFPDYGWVEFEPTASEAPLVRPVRAAPAPNAGGTGNSPTPEPTEDVKNERGDRAGEEDLLPADRVNWTALVQTTALVAGGVILVLALSLGFLLRLGLLGWESLGSAGAWVMRLRRQPAPSPIGAIYLRLERAARWLGVSLPAALTPHERAEAVSQLVPPARPGVEVITDQYVQEQYGGHPADAGSALAAWRDIRFKVWREGVRRFVRSFIKDEEPAGG